MISLFCLLIMSKTEIGKRIRNIRILNGLSQSELGEKLGLTADRIQNIYLSKLNLGVVTTGENLNDILKNCYTGNDFLKECNGHKNIAKALFDFVDWQHPNIQDLTDCYDEEEFYNEFGIHFDDLGND